MSNRDLFAELNSALVEAKEYSEGQITLNTHQTDDATECSTLANETVKGLEQGDEKGRSVAKVLDQG